MTLIDMTTPYDAPVCKHNFKGFDCPNCWYEERESYAKEISVIFHDWANLFVKQKLKNSNDKEEFKKWVHISSIDLYEEFIKERQNNNL